MSAADLPLGGIDRGDLPHSPSLAGRVPCGVLASDNPTQDDGGHSPHTPGGLLGALDEHAHRRSVAEQHGDGARRLDQIEVVGTGATHEEDDLNLYTPNFNVPVRHDALPEEFAMHIERPEGTTRDGEVDEDYLAMAQYDKRLAGAAHHTFSWRMSLSVVCLGFVFSGIAAFSVHWRREGCLVYKLTVLEGTSYDCCSSRYRLPEVVGFLNAERDNENPTPVSPEVDATLAYCTSLANWRDFDAKSAHIIALCCVVFGLIARILAVVAYTSSNDSYRRQFPNLVIVCSVLGFCAIISYSLSWTDAGLSPGPALAYVGLQAILDLGAYFGTVTGSNVGTDGKKRPKVAELVESYSNTPLAVRLIMALYLGFWAFIMVALTMPWKQNPECDEFLATPAEATTPEDHVRPYLFVGETPVPPCLASCLVKYGVLFSYSDCRGIRFIFGSRSERISTMLISAVFVLLSMLFTIIATYYVWTGPALFPKYALASLLMMLIAILAFFGNTSGEEWLDSSYHKSFVAVSLYTVLMLILIGILYCLFRQQLWARGFNRRRKNPHLEAVEADGGAGGGGDGKDGRDASPRRRPIITTREAVPVRVTLMGGQYRRSELQGLQGDILATEWEQREIQRRRALLSRAAQLSLEQKERLHRAAAAAPAAPAPQRVLTPRDTTPQQATRVIDIEWKPCQDNPLDTMFPAKASVAVNRG